MEKISRRQALGWRLRRQYVTQPSPDLVGTASRLLGLHAQVASTTELIAGVRTPAYAVGGIATALWSERSLVKTWGMRGTLHLFPTAELPLFVAAFAQRQWPKTTAAWVRYHGITGDELRRITAAIGDILPGKVLTREELGAEIARSVKSPDVEAALRSGWGQMFKPAAAGGLLCSGPDRGRNVTFTHPRTWVPDAPWDRQPDEGTALAAVIARFLDSYGPATHADFARWWGIDPASARRLFKQHAGVMVEVDLDGTTCWLTPAGVEGMARVRDEDASGTWLLPGFDPYIVAPISRRAHTVPEGFIDRVSRTAGWISPVLLVDGVVRGVWSHQLENGRLTASVEPFGPVGAATKKAVAGAAQRYGELLAAAVDVHWLAPS